MVEPEEDFAALFEASAQARRLERGQGVEGVVVAIGEDVAFVDVGGKGEATIDLEELRDDQGGIQVSVGDRIQAVVVSTAGGVRLSRKLARRRATAQQVEEAFRAGLPVEGRIERAVKGGYEVRIGSERAFCPFSQAGAPGADPSALAGQVLKFRVIEYGEGGRNLVVSRRALIEQEQQARAAEARKAIVVGAELQGRVVSVRDFGAFVDLGGGVQGLLHVSEMSWARVADPAEVVKPGDEVTVKVLRVDEDLKKIALGLKQLTPDPWTKVAETYQVGQARVGRVTRVTDFGAFVELEPGVEALAHASTFAPTADPGGWSASVAPGTMGVFEVLDVDADRRRIGVALVMRGETSAPAAAPASSAAVVPGARLEGIVERHERFGVFVFLAPGRTGLIPMSETGVGEADVRRAFPVGATVDVVVLEADPATRRIRLSAKAVRQAEEADEVRRYQERAGAATGGGLGSLGDRLRDALGSSGRRSGPAGG